MDVGPTEYAVVAVALARTLLAEGAVSHDDLLAALRESPVDADTAFKVIALIGEMPGSAPHDSGL